MSIDATADIRDDFTADSNKDHHRTEVTTVPNLLQSHVYQVTQNDYQASKNRLCMSLPHSEITEPESNQVQRKAIDEKSSIGLTELAIDQTKSTLNYHLPDTLKNLICSQKDLIREFMKLHGEVQEDTHSIDDKECILMYDSSSRLVDQSEKQEYEKVHTFDVDEKGDIVDSEKGFAYRRIPKESHSLVRINSSFDHSPRRPEPSTELPFRKYTVLLIGGQEVGKTSLINQLQSCESLDSVRLNSSSETKEVLAVLIGGREVDVLFVECDVLKNKRCKENNMNFAAILVMYAVNDKSSFDSAIAILHQLRDEGMPITLVANKIDLKQYRIVETNDGKEIARSHNCKFMEVSVLTEHGTDELLKEILIEFGKYEKRNWLVTQE